MEIKNINDAILILLRKILDVLKTSIYQDAEDLVYRMELSYDEIIEIVDIKFIPTKRTGSSLNPGIYEITDINTTLNYILPNNVKVTITIDDIRLKSILKMNQTLMFTKKSFFDTILGFLESHSYPIQDIDGFYQLIVGS